MKIPAATKIAAGSLAVLISAGLAAGITSAATPLFDRTVSAMPRGSDVDVLERRFGGANVFEAAATYIGITVEQLRTEMGTDKSMADVAVAHGKTRDGLIAALNAAVQQDLAALVDHKGAPQGGPGGKPRPGIVAHLELAAAAAYLGTTEADLRTKLQAGQTLAQIADATAGKSRDGLVAALTTAANAAIDQALANGRITADQATQAKSRVAEQVARFVDMTRPADGPRKRR